MAKLSLASNSWDQYLQRSHWAGLLSSGYMRNFTFWSYEEKLWPLITEGIKLKPIWALRAVTVGVTRRTNPSSQLPSPLPTQAVQDITLKSMLAFLPWWESSRKAQRAQAAQVRHTWLTAGRARKDLLPVIHKFRSFLCLGHPLLAFGNNPGCTCHGDSSLVTLWLCTHDLQELHILRSSSLPMINIPA